MQYRELGDSGIDVSEIGLGLWGISGDDTWGEQDRKQAIDTIQAGIDEGITFLDTAEKYGDGRSERILGEAIADYDRSELVVASKVSARNLRPEDLKAACDGSLERLDTNYIDVYYVHWPNHDIPLEETMTAMAELRDEGKIRAIACSNFGQSYLSEAVELGPVVANQLPYSLLWRTIEHGLRDTCITNQVGLVAYSTLCMGLLTGKFDSPDDVPTGRARTRHFAGNRPESRHGESGAESTTFETIDRIREIASNAGINMGQLAIAWVLSRPGVTSALVGARTREQVRENVGAVDLSVSDRTMERLTAATEELASELGDNHDMYQSDSRYNR